MRGRWNGCEQSHSCKCLINLSASKSLCARAVICLPSSLPMPGAAGNPFSGWKTPQAKAQPLQGPAGEFGLSEVQWGKPISVPHSEQFHPQGSSSIEFIWFMDGKSLMTKRFCSPQKKVPPHIQVELPGHQFLPLFLPRCSLKQGLVHALSPPCR